MFITRVSVNGLEETVTYPIVLNIMLDVQKFLGLAHTVPVKIGENPPLLIIKDPNSVNRHIPDNLDRELQVTYHEESRDEADISLTSLVSTANYIYKDDDVRTSIKPILHKRTLNLSITYLDKSKSKVTSLVNRLRMRSPSDTRAVTHDVEYSYYLPIILIELLSEINDRKNTYTDPIVDLDDYIANTFTTQANIVNFETGDASRLDLVMREKQTNVLGTVDTDVHTIEKEKDDDTGRYSFTIDYRVTYEIPTQLLVTYPLAVYNQPIPKKFRLKKKTSNNYGNRTLESDGLQKLSIRDEEFLGIPSDRYYLPIPKEDNLILPKPNTGYIRLFSILTLVDPNDLSFLFYLDEIPGIKFKDNITKLLELESVYLGELFNTIFFMDIYNFDQPEYKITVIATTVTELINNTEVTRIKLTTSQPLSIKGNYRVDFQVLVDLTSLPENFKSRLLSNINIVNTQTSGDMDVLDNVLGIFDLDVSKLNPNFVVGYNTDNWDIATNISNDMEHKVFTKEYTLILTEMLETK